MNNEQKTKFEILRESLSKGDGSVKLLHLKPIVPLLCDAMQLYADQQTAPLLTRISELESELSALKRDEWIKCSERLPEKDGCYLISSLTHEEPDIFHFKDGFWGVYHEGSFLKDTYGIVKVWRPLPPSPTDN